jgi:hypothetical protein
LSVPKAVSRLLLTGIAVLAAALCAQTARADALYLDFSCSGVATCNGGITQAGGNFSTAGITVTEGSGFYAPGSLFTLAFNTATDAISIVGQGALSGEMFSGTITGFQMLSGQATTDINFTAYWPVIPTDVQAYFNSPQGTDSGFAIFLSGTGGTSSADVTITPAPEPAAQILLSAGLLGLGLLMKRKLVVAADSRVA